MSNQLSTTDAADRVESQAYALAPRGETTFVLASALLVAVLKSADYEELTDILADEDAFGSFVDRKELGNFVYEHTLDTFEELVSAEIAARDEGSKDAWEIETELRQMQGGTL